MSSFLFKFPNYVWDAAALLKKVRNGCLSMLFNFSSFFLHQIFTIYAPYALTTLWSKYMTIKTQSVLLLNAILNFVSFSKKKHEKL